VAFLVKFFNFFIRVKEAKMSIDNICPNCGFVFYGERSGKCPNCDEGVYIDSEKHYILDPREIKLFKRLYREGGFMEYFKRHAPKEKITVLDFPSDKSWVSLSVLGSIITFKNYGKGPEIIADIPNQFGYDIPETTMTEAVKMATRILSS
jgi:hypothetical protein